MTELKIYTHGSRSLGLGHVRRSLSLAKDISTDLVTTVSVVEGFELISEEERVASSVLIKPGVVKPSKSDLVLIDMDKECGKQLYDQFVGSQQFMALDWFDTKRLPAICWNLYDHSQQMRKAFSSKIRGSLYFEGPQYAIIRDEIRRLRPRHPQKTPYNRVNITVTIGGADPYKRTLDVADDLRKLGKHVNELTFIVGELTESRMEDELSKLLRGTNYQIMRAPKKFAEYLANADLVVCNGGTTLLESMHLGKPTVVYPQTEAERSHAVHHAHNGACSLSEELEETVASEYLREKLACKAWETVDGKGSRRIAETIRANTEILVR